MVCPDFENGKERLCRASVTGLRPGAWEEENYCAGEDFDRCAIFLSRALRLGAKRRLKNGC